MFVYMKKDLEKVGMKGQLLKVSRGYAQNFLIPKGFAIEVKDKEQSFFKAKSKKVEKDKAIVETRATMLAERIGNLNLTISEKVHDDGKLYGAVSQEAIVDALAKKDISVTKKQVEFAKSIKTTGEHKATIRLSSKLKPELKVKVVSIKQ